jgi:hypothetical protein
VKEEPATLRNDGPGLYTWAPAFQGPIPTDRQCPGSFQLSRSSSWEHQESGRCNQIRSRARPHGVTFPGQPCPLLTWTHGVTFPGQPCPLLTWRPALPVSFCWLLGTELSLLPLWTCFSWKANFIHADIKSVPESSLTSSWGHNMDRGRFETIRLLTEKRIRSGVVFVLFASRFKTKALLPAPSFG